MFLALLLLALAFLGAVSCIGEHELRDLENPLKGPSFKWAGWPNYCIMYNFEDCILRDESEFRVFRPNQNYNVTRNKNAPGLLRHVGYKTYFYASYGPNQIAFRKHEVSIIHPTICAVQVLDHDPSTWVVSSKAVCGWRCFSYDSDWIFEDMFDHRPRGTHPRLPDRSPYKIGRHGVLAWFRCFTTVGTIRTFQIVPGGKFQLRFYRAKLKNYDMSKTGACNLTLYSYYFHYTLNFKISLGGEEGWVKHNIRFTYENPYPMRAAVSCFIDFEHAIMVLDSFRYTPKDTYAKYCPTYVLRATAPHKRWSDKMAFLRRLSPVMMVFWLLAIFFIAVCCANAGFYIGYTWYILRCACTTIEARDTMPRVCETAKAVMRDRGSVIAGYLFTGNQHYNTE